jgi:hypothetical protein
MPINSTAGALLALLLFAMIGFVLFMHGAATRPSPSAVSVRTDLGPVVAQMVGGAMWRVWGIPWRVTAPMASLEVARDGIRVGPSGAGLGWIVPTWEWQWSELESAEEAYSKLRIRPRDGRGTLAFLVLRSRDRERLLSLITDDIRAHSEAPT